MSERFEWYYMGETGQVGPLSEVQILDLAEHGILRRDSLVWKVGMSGWAPAETLPKLAAKMQPTFSPPPVVAPPPLPSQSEPSMRGAVQCPRDGAPMRRESKAGVEIDVCPSCRGVWLDRGELDKILEREGGYRDDDDDDYRRHKKRRGFDILDIFD